MATKKILCLLVLLSISLFTGIVQAEMTTKAPQQVIQINTKFRDIQGRPSWLIILRDVDTGQVLPYLYDIENNDNYWIAFSLTHKYRVVASVLKFGATSVINNFCRIEGGVFIKTSMFVSLSGDLTPDSRSSKCHVLKYQQDNFPIVTNTQ